MYCVIPRALSPLEPTLERYYAGRGIRMIVERRRGDRRLAARRNDASPRRGPELRRVRNTDGRRAGERRAELVPAPAPALPLRARACAGQIAFYERVEPTARHSQDLDDARLVIRAQSGECSAFADLYSRNFDPIYNYLRLALRDWHEAEDVAQDVFIKMLKLLPSYEVRSEQPLRVLLFRIARNAAIDHRRKHAPVDCEAPETIDQRREVAAHDGLTALLDRLSDGELAVFLRRLPESQRQVLALRFMVDFTNDEIADVMGISAQAVRNLQHRALGFLRERFKERELQDVRPQRRAAMLRRLRPSPVLIARRVVLW